MIENINGIDVYLHQTTKFKQISVAVFFQNELDLTKATLRSVLAYLLVDCNDNFENKEMFRQHLESLYGTTLSQVSYAQGKKHVIGVLMNSISGKLVGDKKLIDEQLKVLRQSLLSHKSFTQEQLDLAKKFIKSQLHDIYENKSSYACQQLATLVAKDTKYHISAIGDLEQLDKITLDELNEYYQSLFKSDRITVVAVGDINEKSVSQFVSSSFGSNIHLDFDVIDRSSLPVVYSEKTECQDVTQAKLSLGYRIDSDLLSNNHYAANMFNGIFGGMSHSLLFKVVREKHSLCYSIRSNYDPYHGLITVNLGIANHQKELALELIQKQLECIVSGDFDDDLISMTYLHLESVIKKTADSAQSLMMQAFKSASLNRSFDMQQQIECYQKVTKSDIMRIAKSVELEAVFFLQGGNESGN